MLLLVAILIVLGTLAYLGYPLLVRDRSYSPDQTDALVQLEELRFEKETLLQAIKDLEFDLASGKLSPEDYAALRGRYETRAMAMLQELDAREAVVSAAAQEAGATRAAEPAPMSAPRSLWARPVLATSVIGALVVIAAGGGFLLGRVRPEDRMGEMASEVRQGSGAAMVADLEARLKQNPQDVNTLVGLGRIYLQTGQMPEAIEMYKRVLELDAGNVSALSGMAMILAQAGHSEQALALFDKVLAINPQFPMALLFKGRLLYEEKKDYAGAIASWESFLKTVPQGEPADVVRGWIEEARREARQNTDDSWGRKTP